MAAITVGQALTEFRLANGLAADEYLRRSWTCKIGRFTIRLPNFAWRRDAILAHDLHHLLTGYPCTLRGECHMAAWEFGAGPMPHWAASLFCLPLIPWGLIWWPRSTWRAFLRGRRSQSLHAAECLDHFLRAPLDDVQKAFA
jgi:hypothetical protein